jgi:GNAT superfamily N-acetyltransferase
VSGETPAVRPVEARDRAWAASLLEERWGPGGVVTRGRLHRPEALPAFLALLGDRPSGLATYRIEGDECELVTLDSLEEGRGVGTVLLAAVEGAAREAGCRRLRLVTTNDNTGALRFYQRRGLVLAALRANALEESRRLKPGIPRCGAHGIPLRDEIELERYL